MNGTSYSGIATYQRCPKQYYYKEVERLEPIEQNINLFQGIVAHDLMKEFFLGMQDHGDPVLSWDRVLDSLEETLDGYSKVMFADELAEADKLAAQILNTVDRYVGRYAEEWEVLHVEEEFLVMINNRVVTFTPDLVVRDRAGYVWVVDHKTTSGSYEDGIPFGDMQAMLYFSGVQSLYPEVKGFLFNRLRKKAPTEPRLTKTKPLRVYDLNRIDTTYEILRDFLKENAPKLLDDPRHQRRLAELRDAGDRFFWTETVYVPDVAVEQIIDDVDFVIDQIERSKETGRFPRHLYESRGYKDCRSCDFSRLCQAELLGWDTEELRLEAYQERGAKNPYEGEYQ